MSEKINELIKSVKDLKYDSSTGTFETDRRALFEFAELIVRECIRVIEVKMPDFTCKEDYENLIRRAGRMDAINEIEQHFGVE